MLENIFREVLKPVRMDTSIKAKFFNLIQKENAEIAIDEFINLKEQLLSIGFEYNMLFYEDAIISLQTGAAFKSENRDNYRKNKIN
ncbi:MAG: hypothetical protein IPG12_17060 [Saprospiraceae bacterium]|nr:hypothetical protein [Saprospiraceae bacterium]